jgi:hypothetical protein
MAEVIDLERFRAKVAADAGFRTWLARFKEQFGPDTKLAGLSPQTLLYLATPGEENLYVYFDLIMGARGLGASLRFRVDDLDNPTKLQVLDTAFALVDRVRFEVMRRLGWVDQVPGGELPLIELVQQAWRQGPAFARETPRLSPRHLDYPAYSKLPAMDQTVFIRRLIPRAVAQFRELLETGS